MKTGSKVGGRARAFWRLDRADVDGLLAVARGAHTVELKLRIEEEVSARAAVALGIDFARARRRRVFYVDTPELALARHGVVLRVRSVEGGRDDSVVKLRSGVASEPVPGRRIAVEIDGMPGSYVRTFAARRRLGQHDIGLALAGHLSLAGLFSDRQLALAPDLAAHALTMIGPAAVRRCKVELDGLGSPLVAQRWAYPDGARFTELSLRCDAAGAARALTRSAEVLSAHGVVAARRQGTKAATTLRRCAATEAVVLTRS